MNKKNKEIDAINIQLIALFLILISSIISILLTYNQKLDLEEKDTLYTPKQSYKLTLFNRIFIIILSIVFLYVKYELYEVSKEEGEDLKPYILQIFATILTIISGIIVLYVVLQSTTENVSDVENPII